MLTIRLQRVGKKNQASFRVVLADHRHTAKSGEKEVLGSFNPHTKELRLKEERIKYWLGQGAQISDTMRDWLVKKNLLPKKEIKFTKKHPKKKKAEADAKKTEKKPEPAKSPAK